MAVGTGKVALIRANPEVDSALLGLVQKCSVEPREAIVVDFTAKLLLYIPFALASEVACHEVARARPHAVRDVVPGDVEDLALIGHATNHDMAVRVTGVEVIDRNPIKGRIEVTLHLPHQAARERLEIAKGNTILGSNDEAELMPVLLAPIGKRLGVGVILKRGVCMPRVPIGSDTLTLQIAQMRRYGLALGALELDHPCLDDDAAGPEAHAWAPGGARLELPAAVPFE